MKLFHLLPMLGVMTLLFTSCSSTQPTTASTLSHNKTLIPLNETIQLTLPKLSQGQPAADRKVAVTAPEYAGTQVHHTLYLPKDWSAQKVAQGQTWPVIFEYTGNQHKPTGSTGKVENAALGYGLSAGQFIWVSLPYISPDHQQNQLKWWGDTEATVNYAKTNVPRIIRAFGGNPETVFLCCFSRGAIAVNHLGLHDDEVAKLWSGFIVHDHFDGEKEWRGQKWDSPYAIYEKESVKRLSRVNGRPYLITSVRGQRTQSFIEAHTQQTQNFTYLNTNTKAIFGKFPNAIAHHNHTDRWPLVPNSYRIKAWHWLNQQLEKQQ